MSFAIKRNGDDIEFADLLDPGEIPQNNIKNYHPFTSDLQLIENKNYLVLYDRFYYGEIKMLSILVNSLLSKIDSLSSSEISQVMTEPLRRFLKHCHKLTIQDDGTESMSGRIVIFGEEKIILMDGFFLTYELNKCLDGRDVTMLALDECTGDTALDLMKRLGRANNNGDYVIQYGSVNSDYITVESSSGQSLQFKKEDYVCRY